MRRIIFIVAIIVICTFVISCNKQRQTVSNNQQSENITRGDLLNFLDIPWGASIETALEILELRGNREITVRDNSQSYSWETDVERIRRETYWANQKSIISTGEFAGIFRTQITLDFYHNKFYQARVDTNENLQFTFNRLYDLLSKRYWEIDLSTSVIHNSYTWSFDNNCYILLLMNKLNDGKITISYVENELHSEVAKIHNDIDEKEMQERNERIFRDL